MIKAYSREEDPTLVRCQDCGWQGPIKDCIASHDLIPPIYHFSGSWPEPEATDFCPQCLSTQIWEVNDET